MSQRNDLLTGPPCLWLYPLPGVLLSGGLDSSLVAAIASRKVSPDTQQWGKLHSFCIGLPGSPDLAAARQVSMRMRLLEMEVSHGALTPADSRGLLCADVVRAARGAMCLSNTVHLQAILLLLNCTHKQLQDMTRCADVVVLCTAVQVADFLGTCHHELTFTVQEGIDAISDVIYHIETYDVTTIRASTPMFLMSRKIKVRHSWHVTCSI